MNSIPTNDVNDYCYPCSNIRNIDSHFNFRNVDSFNEYIVNTDTSSSFISVTGLSISILHPILYVSHDGVENSRNFSQLSELFLDRFQLPLTLLVFTLPYRISRIEFL